MTSRQFHGIVPALVTPMLEDGEVDWASYVSLIQRGLEAGVHGFVPAGTTGESPTLSHEEHDEIISVCVKEVNGQVPVLAGTGSNSTAEAVKLTCHAETAGADAALVVTPYYNKPTQDGLYEHYRTIADNTKLPIFIYNIPGRCVIDMSVDTMRRLFEDCSNIVGVKDATNDLQRPQSVRCVLGENFYQLSGEDGTFAAFLSQGGNGIISVGANVAPHMYVGMYNAWHASDMPSFCVVRDKLFALNVALFCESSPSPVKYALSRLGLCGEHVRLPLLAASLRAREEIDSVLRDIGLLN